jgi:hypothetical protein
MGSHVLRSLVLLLLLPSLLLAVRARAQSELESGGFDHHAEDASAEVVTPRNLLASERFWPYQVTLAKPWRPPGGAEPLPPGSAGVLIRVEDSGRARIDFGRDGLHEVPVEATDLIERANRVRQGQLDKMAPNFVLDIAPRLADPSGDSLRPFGLRAAMERSSFLCVFADPSAQGFAELAAALATLRDRAGVLTILFPQGEHSDARLREQLRLLGWPTPFVFDHLAEPYTRSLLGEAIPLPALLLVTKEGRVRFQRSWTPALMPELSAAIDRADSPDDPATAGAR